MNNELKSKSDVVVTALLGSPVNHSLSQIMFGHYALSAGIAPYTHIKVEIPTALPLFLDWAIKGLVGLGCAGANVTLPYKEDVIKLLDEVDEDALRLGAVNTIYIRGSRLIGCNTDGEGALKSICAEARTVRENDRVVLFGAGGAARALAYALCQRCRDITIINRTFERAANISSMFNDIFGDCMNALSLEDFLSDMENARQLLTDADFIINATSVGMSPDFGQSIIPNVLFEQIDARGKVYYDAIYNPIETEFLKRARARNAKTVNGLGMMLWQGARAFHLWTSSEVSSNTVDGARSLLVRHLEAKHQL